MTRETRIGLVVGLTFIVLFGAVLSELATSAETAEGGAERMSKGFYVRAPVRPTDPPRRGEPVAWRRSEAQRPPQRAPQHAVEQTPPTPPALRDPGEMTAEGFLRQRRSEQAGNPKTYITRRGDNLTAIARKFYRAPSLAGVMKIYNANRDVLQSPDTLAVDVKLVIPN